MAYGQAVGRLEDGAILIGRWGSEQHATVLEKIMARVAEFAEGKDGYGQWTATDWYPALRLAYAGGIAALVGESYPNLARVLFTVRHPTDRRRKQTVLLEDLAECVLDLERNNVFRILPGFERFYVPHSEYLHRTLQPRLDDLLLLGNAYDAAFDRFEALLSLVYMDLDWDNRISVTHWAPIGRFGWKENRGAGPIAQLVKEVEAAGGAWVGFAAGFFGGKKERFDRSAQELLRNVQQLKWR